jgi:hypothetical protein
MSFYNMYLWIVRTSKKRDMAPNRPAASPRSTNSQLPTTYFGFRCGGICATRDMRLDATACDAMKVRSVSWPVHLAVPSATSPSSGQPRI